MYNIYDELNRVTAYIENHILEEINIRELARIAKLNVNAFKDVFNCLAGISITEYIRFRRLSLSINDILNGESITSISYKYLYNSPSSYNRAFKKFEGISPREIKKNEGSLKLFNRIVFREKIDNYNVDFKIYKNKEIVLYGISKRIDLENRTKEIPRFWKDVKNHYREFLDSKRYGILTKVNDEAFYHCLLENEFKNSTKLTIPKCNYFAIKTYSFESQNIINNINKSMGEYVKSINYKILNLPKIEIYYENYVEILIPIT